MKVCLAGHGAFGIKHLEAMSRIPDIEVISLAGSNMESAREVAQQWKIPHWTADLAESLARPGLDAVILTTPTQMHAAQGVECMRAGKHVTLWARDASRAAAMHAGHIERVIGRDELSRINPDDIHRNLP